MAIYWWVENDSFSRGSPYEGGIYQPLLWMFIFDFHFLIELTFFLLIKKSLYILPCFWYTFCTREALHNSLYSQYLLKPTCFTQLCFLKFYFFACLLYKCKVSLTQCLKKNPQKTPLSLDSILTTLHPRHLNGSTLRNHWTSILEVTARPCWAMDILSTHSVPELLETVQTSASIWAISPLTGVYPLSSVGVPTSLRSPKRMDEGRSGKFLESHTTQMYYIVLSTNRLSLVHSQIDT